LKGVLGSGIKDLGAKYDIEFTPNIRHNIKTGIAYTFHTFTPSSSALSVKTNSQSLIDSNLNEQRILADEIDVYLEDDWKISDKLRANIGFHASTFNVQDTTYPNIQPRVSARYLINEDYSIKASYARMYQFINLLSFDGIGLPTDYWVPITKKLSPQVSDQIAIGAAGTLNKMFELSAEVYYKTMQNIIDYKDGRGYLNAANGYEDIVEMGRGLCYGGELFLQKKEGKLQGMVGYGLAWAKRKYETINFGQWFYYKYDRRHDFKIAAVYKLSDKVELSGDWVYNTGSWNTIPQANVIYSPSNLNNNNPYIINNVISLYPQRNNYNLKDYHRMDLAVRFIGSHKKREVNWAFGCYNLYGRKNTFFLLNQDTQLYGSQFMSFSIFGFPLPYIAYNIKF
jgi:hypothetical protein